MHKFILDNSNLKKHKGLIVPPKELLHQLKNVLQIKSKKFVVVLNKKEYVANLIEYKYIQLLEEVNLSKEISFELILLQAVPKTSKISLIIQKAAELNVSKIIFFNSKRSISKMDQKTFNSKLERFSKIAKEAAEQSNKKNIISFDFFESISLLPSLNNFYKFICFEKFVKLNLHNVEKKISSSNKIVFAIGPEGGFEKDEVNQFEKKGFDIIWLGEFTLRTETASFYVSSILNYLKKYGQ